VGGYITRAYVTGYLGRARSRVEPTPRASSAQTGPIRDSSSIDTIYPPHSLNRPFLGLWSLGPLSASRSVSYFFGRELEEEGVEGMRTQSRAGYLSLQHLLIWVGKMAYRAREIPWSGRRDGEFALGDPVGRGKDYQPWKRASGRTPGCWGCA